MTKVRLECCVSTDPCLTRKIQVFFPVGKTVKNTAGQSPDDIGLVNQYGLSRKVKLPYMLIFGLRQRMDCLVFSTFSIPSSIVWSVSEPATSTCFNVGHFITCIIPRP